jgi:hypothetical protein
MRRLDFMKELGNSLFETIKAVYEPFIKEDIEKMEDVANMALGITWHPLMKKTEASAELEMKFIRGKPIIVARYGTNMQVMDGVCPVCSNIIILTTLYLSGKCLNCEKEYNFITQTGDFQPEPLRLKLKDEMYYIGLSTTEKSG